MGYQILVIGFSLAMVGCFYDEVEPRPIDTSIDASAANLSADEAFTFSNQQSVLLDINLPELSEERTAVNVCYPAEDGSIDRGNCLLQSSLQDGVLVTELSPGAHQTSLLMEIWSFSDLSEPMSYNWSYSDGQNWFIR